MATEPGAAKSTTPATTSTIWHCRSALACSSGWRSGNWHLKSNPPSVYEKHAGGGEGLRRGGDGALVVHDLANLRPLLVAQCGGIDAEIVAGLHPALDCGAVADLVEPAFELFELTDVLALGLGVDGPRIGNHVGDRVLVAGEIAPVVEPVVHDAVEPVRLVGEAADSIGQVAGVGAGAAEMSAFAELRALIGHLPYHPLRDLVPPAKVLWEEAAFLFTEIHHDRA